MDFNEQLQLYFSNNLLDDLSSLSEHLQTLCLLLSSLTLVSKSSANFPTQKQLLTFLHKKLQLLQENGVLVAICLLEIQRVTNKAIKMADNL